MGDRLAELEREEPLSLAEELDKAAERVRRSGKTIERTDKPDPNIHIAALQRMSMPELIELAGKEGVEETTGLKKQDLIFRVLKNRVRLDGMMFGEGTLEILPDGFGFLRSPDYHYLSCPDDIYVSPSQIRRFGLHTGAIVAGTIRPPKENERYFALLRIEAINGGDPNLLSKKIFFDNLTPNHPDARIVMETTAEKNRNARGRHDRPARLWPTRSDRQSPPSWQDDSHAGNGQKRIGQLPRCIRLHAPD